MARAENQGLQIALIVFVMLTIVFGVTTFLYFRNYEEAMIANKKATEEANTANSVKNNVLTEMGNVKTVLLGVDQQMSFKDLEEAFKNDMKQFGAAMPEASQHYRQALEHLFNSQMAVSGQLATSQLEVKRLQDQLKLREEERDKQMAIVKTDFNTKVKDAETEAAGHREEMAQVKAMQSELLLARDQRTGELELARNEAGVKEGTLRKEVTRLTDLNIGKGEIIKGLTNPAFEVADGSIVSVDPASKTLYVNLGRGDNLGPLVTFSVHDPEANTANGDGLKGKIEITRIVDQHMAWARILDEDYHNPITSGDKIYSPLWQAGQAQHFAILGDIDLDKDGRDDRELVKDLISSQGGVIDAEMDPQGKITGEITHLTRYLVTGPTKDNAQVRGGESAMRKEADIHGAEVIPAQKFFEYIGWKNQHQLFKSGPEGTRENLPFHRPDGGVRTTTPSASTDFLKRKPKWKPEKPKAASAYIEESEKEAAAKQKDK